MASPHPSDGLRGHLSERARLLAFRLIVRRPTPTVRHGGVLPADGGPSPLRNSRWSCYRSRMFKHWFSLVVPVLLTACVSPPNVRVTGSGHLAEQTADASAGSILVQVENPNDRSIRLVEYDYSATVPGGPGWHGRHAGGMVLSPGFDRIASLPIVLPAGFPSNGTVHVTGSLHYLDTGTFAQTLAEWGYRPTASFSGKVVLEAATAQD